MHPLKDHRVRESVSAMRECDAPISATHSLQHRHTNRHLSKRFHNLSVGLLQIVALLVTMLIAGCDNTIEPFAESNRYFAIFGYLDADRDSHFVRIEPTRSNPELGRVSFDVESVWTTDLDTGERVFWSDSLIDLANGTTGLLYFGQFKPVRGHSYRLEVTRTDGLITSAETTVPSVPSLSVRRPDRRFGGALEQGLLFDGVVRQPEQVIVNYAVTFGTLADPLEVKLPYNVFGAPEGSGWRIIVRLTRDKSTVFERLSVTVNDNVALHTLSIDLRLLSSDWPLQNAGIDETNVRNGYGFFGSAATHHATWILESSFVSELGMIDKQESTDDGE